MDHSSSSPSPPPPSGAPGTEFEGGRTPRSSKKHSKKKDKRAAEKAAAAAQQEFVRQLTSLQLPHMPDMSLDGMDYDSSGRVEPPTLRILIVADIDLASASALAESALAASDEDLEQGHHGGRESINLGSGGSERRSSSGVRRKGDDKPENLLNRVDLCIACGPFCREEDLRQYYQGRQRRRHFQRTSAYTSPASVGGYGYNQSRASRSSMYPPSGFGGSGGRNSYNHSSPHNHYSHHHQHHNHSSTNHIHHQQHPFRRTREETAALEGLMTAALSQLESIVCRVVFVPGRSDPVSTITSSSSGNNSNNNSNSSMLNGTNPTNLGGTNNSSYYNQLFYTKERRLTPNSRNIHRHWMPLSPGLGCGGLLYMDCQKMQQPPPLEDDDDDDDDSSSRSSILEESSATFHDDNNGNPAMCPPTSGEFGSNPDDIPDDMPPMADHSETTTQHYAERAQQYGTEFCKTLERLVQLAPPTTAVTDTPTNSQITNLLKTNLFQTILVSNFHHLEPDEDDDLTMYDHGDMSAGNLNQNGENLHDYSINSGGYSSPNAAAAAEHSEESSSRQPRDDENHSNSEAATATYGEDESDQEEEESFDPPWPTEHEAFCALPHVQEHVILEIASGLNSSGGTVKPMEVPKGKVRVVLPGSLRERGEFCLVDVAFMKDPYQPRANDYRWRVRKTRFQTINEFL